MQAYRMSIVLPKTLLNRFYIILLAATCWSSVVVYSLFFKRDEARRQFACIVLDCVLDLMACMGVELIVLMSYAKNYKPALLGFPEIMWNDDEWVARALIQFKMVIVVSWSDLASRSLGLIITTMSMKELLQCLSRTNVNRVTQFDGTNTKTPNARTASHTFWADKLNGVSPKLSPPQQSKRSHLKREDSYRDTNLRSRGARFVARVNMTDGLLPAGLQSIDFPSAVYDIEICSTNLRELPDDLDAKWPADAIIQVEYSQLTTVPLVHTRLQPYYLAVTGNPIKEIPPEVFEVQGTIFFSISNMNIRNYLAA
ncbi:hypothetical protein PRNP1_005418 [Phytophthora ramorum]